MQQHTKAFASRLNRCLDDLGMPVNVRERSAIFSKMMHIPKQQAWSLLEGHAYPDGNLLNQLAVELEVDTDCLQKK